MFELSRNRTNIKKYRIPLDRITELSGIYIPQKINFIQMQQLETEFRLDGTKKNS